MFRDCPYQQKHQKFRRSAATDFGNAVHAGLAEMLQGGDFWEAYNGMAGKLNVPLDKKNDAQKCLEYAQKIKIPEGHIITVESDDGDVEFYGKKFFQVPMTDTWGFRGAMDAVYIDKEGRLTILDWKTGLSKDEDDLQLAIYALAAWRKYGACTDTIITKFVYVQQGVTTRTTWDKESLVGAFEYVSPLVDEFYAAHRENKFPRTPHSWCKFCDLKDGCEPYNRQITVKADVNSYNIPATLENLPKIIEYFDKVKSIASAAYAAQAMLRRAYEEVLITHGKQTIDGRTYEVRDRINTYDYDLPIIFQEISEIVGRPPLEICKFYKTGFDEIRRELEPEDKKRLDDIIKTNREVKSKTKTLCVAISKDSQESDVIEIEAKKE